MVRFASRATRYWHPGARVLARSIAWAARLASFADCFCAAASFVELPVVQDASTSAAAATPATRRITGGRRGRLRDVDDNTRWRAERRDREGAPAVEADHPRQDPLEILRVDDLDRVAEPEAGQEARSGVGGVRGRRRHVDARGVVEAHDEIGGALYVEGLVGLALVERARLVRDLVAGRRTVTELEHDPVAAVVHGGPHRGQERGRAGRGRGLRAGGRPRERAGRRRRARARGGARRRGRGRGGARLLAVDGPGVVTASARGRGGDDEKRDHDRPDPGPEHRRAPHEGQGNGRYDPADAAPHPEVPPCARSPTPTSSSSRPSARRSGAATAAWRPCIRRTCWARSSSPPWSVPASTRPRSGRSSPAASPRRASRPSTSPARPGWLPGCRSTWPGRPSTRSAGRRSRPRTSPRRSSPRAWSTWRSAAGSSR